ncbi:hypothetical protein BCR34DRAFT_116241 [Clohesyomyces aquaticus]|uniref:Uncharacterized protein n=1 Tax=Clohesyomyces aquaticus TaxID=1231657 RepID=A0A1Y1YQ60_9PLEO|nr:hypothetical protein BCR34DRAFT_116241 [Clohesyomyces aquaticus]
MDTRTRILGMDLNGLRCCYIILVIKERRRGRGTRCILFRHLGGLFWGLGGRVLVEKRRGTYGYLELDFGTGVWGIGMGWDGLGGRYYSLIYGSRRLPSRNTLHWMELGGSGFFWFRLDLDRDVVPGAVMKSTETETARVDWSGLYHSIRYPPLSSLILIVLH